jgi:glycosyltransferase involved in cell wall biosynthesis
MPFFSIVTPVYNPPIWALQACIDSVLSQTFTDWEWCIADDFSTDPKVHKVLRKLAKKDKRVRVEFRAQNGGIVDASNTAIAAAVGEFIVLLDHDDSLTANALAVVNETISMHPEVDYLYSDEDKIDEEGNIFDYFQKPDFSPERLRGQNYCSHLSVLRKSLLEKVGYFRSGFDGSQDYDLILRATEQARKICHIPKVLYHWRVVAGSTAGDVGAKPMAFSSAHQAVKEHCERIGLNADVQSSDFGFVKVKRLLSSHPKVSIIIPTRGDRKDIWGINTCLPANAVRSVLERSTYPNFEIVLVHDTVHVLDKDLEPLLADNRVTTIWYSKPFDFSDKCNVGVSHSSGEIIILLNDDTEIFSEDWIETLVGYLEDKDVAAVGPLTMLEDGRMQSAGHSNSPSVHNIAGGDSIQSTGPFGSRLVTREISGITGACMAIPRDVYFELGGYSRAFPHSYNDVDFAFKALEKNYRIIWTPLAKIWHFESLSRNPQVREDEFNLLHRRWGRYFGQDRFSSHLS